MKIITSRPVSCKELCKSGSADEDFYNISDKRQARKDAKADRKSDNAEVKKYGDITSSVLNNASPLLSLFKRKEKETAQAPTYAPPPVEEKKGMSKGLKIGLIVGGSVLGLIIIGVVIYAIKKKK